MNEDNQDQFNVLRTIQNKPESSQRELAKELGFSLGKLNYCLNALVKKGFVKVNNFKKNPNKIGYIYVLTPKGIKKKGILKDKMVISFLKGKFN